ncbi:MAG: tetratricopeptide repeat protein [Caldilineaceae bacterium]
MATNGIANALNNLGSNYARNGDHDRALPLYQETYEAALLVGERLMIAVALSNLGSASRSLGHYATAQRNYEQSLIHCRAMGERRWTAAGLNGLGLTLLDMGQNTAAATYLQEALQIAQEIGSMPDALDALAGLGQGYPLHASRSTAATLLTFVAEHKVTQTPARQRCREALQRLRSQLAPAELVAAEQRAATLDIQQAAVLVQELYVAATA